MNKESYTIPPAFKDAFKLRGGQALALGAAGVSPYVGSQLLDRSKETAEDIKNKDIKGAIGSGLAGSSRLILLSLLAGPALRGVGLTLKAPAALATKMSTASPVGEKALGHAADYFGEGSKALESAGQSFSKSPFTGKTVSPLWDIPVVGGVIGADMLAEKIRNRAVPDMPGTSGMIEKQVKTKFQDVLDRLHLSKDDRDRKKELTRTLDALTSLKQASMDKEALLPLALAWPVLKILGGAGMAYLSGKQVLEDVPQAYRAFKAGDWKSGLLHGGSAAINTLFAPMMGAGAVKGLSMLPSVMRAHKISKMVKGTEGATEAINALSPIKPRWNWNPFNQAGTTRSLHNQQMEQFSNLGEKYQHGENGVHRLFQKNPEIADAIHNYNEKRLMNPVHNWTNKAMNKVHMGTPETFMGQTIPGTKGTLGHVAGYGGLAQMALPIAGINPTSYGADGRPEIDQTESVVNAVKPLATNWKDTFNSQNMQSTFNAVKARAGKMDVDVRNRANAILR